MAAPIDLPMMGRAGMSGFGTPDYYPPAPAAAPVGGGYGRAGGLGGFGGFFSGPTGDMLSAMGMSLLSSPRNAPLANFGTYLNASQDNRRQQSVLDLELQERADKKAKEQAALEKQNKTLAFLRERFPDIAATVDAGLSVDKGFEMAAAREKLKNPDETFFADPISMKGADGKVTFAQIGNRGTVRPMHLPAGARMEPKPTEDTRELEIINRERAVAQLPPLRLDEWITGRARAGATNIDTGKAETEFDKAVGKGYGERFLDFGKEEQSARRALGALSVMEKSLSDPGFYSGVGSGSVTSLKRMANSLSIPGADGIDSMETFNAMAKQAALDAMGGSLGSGFSNADRDFVLDRVPGLQNTEQGNKALIDIQRRVAQRKLEIAQFARDYASSKGGRIGPEFDTAVAQWSEANPLFPEGQAGGETWGAGGAAGPGVYRATNPQTGQQIEWNGREWVPMQ